MGPLGVLARRSWADLSGYSDILMPASVCTIKVLRRAAALDELHDAAGRPCPLGSDPPGYFERKVLSASDHHGMVAAVHEAEGPPPRVPKELQSPIRSLKAARRMGAWFEWREKNEGETHGVFITYSSFKAGRRRSRLVWSCRS